jgi:tetratricopeptide (TPR) repeat protein
MARVCLAHNDKAEALAQVNEAQQLYADSTWPADYAITERAQLAALRFQVGDEKKARAEINAAAGQYEPGKKNIVDIYRAGILRSLAESYLAMGDTRAASEYYKKAVDAGVENPNSRPRAEDLTATCVSIALHAYQPDPRLWQRLGQVNAALREPW